MSGGGADPVVLSTNSGHVNGYSIITMTVVQLRPEPPLNPGGVNYLRRYSIFASCIFLSLQFDVAGVDRLQTRQREACLLPHDCFILWSSIAVIRPASAGRLPVSPCRRGSVCRLHYNHQVLLLCGLRKQISPHLAAALQLILKCAHAVFAALSDLWPNIREELIWLLAAAVLSATPTPAAGFNNKSLCR